jgi:hypothetical protein
MQQRKTILIFSFCTMVMQPFTSIGQRIVSEARLLYTVTAYPEKGMEKLAEAFTNTTQTVWLRGNLARIDFSAPLREQTTFYNAATGSATILRTSGEDKYQWNFDAEGWKENNKKWADAHYKETGETLEISGFLSKKIIATLKDSNVVTIYYTPQLVPLSRGYDVLFAPLEGVAVQYEMLVDGLKVVYTLQSLQTGPVGASRFDIPTGGYKTMAAQKN